MRDAFLSFKMRHHVGALSLDVAFDLSAPWTMLFGPSGSGKSTILRVIQGLLRADSAELSVGGRTLIGPAVFIPAHRRPIRYAAQRPALFPHLDVRQNLLWGAAEHAPLAEVLQLFRLEHLAAAPPHRLSGGERQRVNAARAVLAAASSPGNLLLLDEPFNGLDHSLRDNLALDLHAWLGKREIPVLSVTHDVVEPFLLKAEVLRLQAGRIAAQGTAGDVLAQERRRMLAGLGAGDVPHGTSA